MNLRFGAAIAALLCVTFAKSSYSATLIYEGFAAGGAAPGAGQYQSDPVSTDGTNNDSLRGQGPAGVGFSSGVNWGPASGTDAVASVVYPRVLNSGLSYSDTSGNTLNTTEGAADWHRDASSTSIFPKRETRSTNLAPPLDNTGYFSALFQFTDGTEGQIELTQHDGGGGNSRDFFFGFDDQGRVIAGTSTSLGNSETSAGSFAAGQTYLLFGELVNDGVNDDLRLWINPNDLADPTADVPLFDSSNIGPGWVGGNGSFTIRDVNLFANTFSGSQFIFDEIRVGQTAGDVLPFTAAVPEPASIALWALLGLMGLGYGWRRMRQR